MDNHLAGEEPGRQKKLRGLGVTSRTQNPCSDSTSSVIRRREQPVQWPRRAPTRRFCAVGAWVALAVLTLGSCSATPKAVPAAPSPPARIHAQWTGCQSTGAFSAPDGTESGIGSGPADVGSVPADFVATTALVCSVGVRTSAGGDAVQVHLEQRADEIAALLTYLARPSQNSTDPDSQACPAMAWARPYLFLRDADGRWLAPAIPHDVCGFPLDQFTDAGPLYTRLRYTDRVVGRGRVLETAAARASGCAMAWKDMITIEAAGATPSPLAEGNPFGEGKIRVCLYSVAKADRSSFTPTGDFVRGGVLDRTQRRRLLTAWTGTAAAACRDRATQFAVVQSTDADPSLYVELDGCRRIFDPGTGAGTARLATANHSLIALIAAVAR